MKKNLYFPALDGLRFFAFFWVFLGHLPRPESFLNWFQKTNWIGVDIFFVLSSFLITVLLLQEFSVNKIISFKYFVYRRLLRLYPLYFLVVILGGIIFPYLNYDIGPSFMEIYTYVPMYLIGIANITNPIMGGNMGNVLSPLWSIMVEFQFYFFIVPIIVYLINKNKIEYLVVLSLFLIIMALVCRYIISDPLFIYGNLIGRLDAFAIGILLGYFYFKDIKLIKNKFNIFILLISCLLFYFVSKLGHPTNTNTSIFIYTLSAFASFFLIYSILNLEFLKKILTQEIFVKLGQISFGLYVFHTLGIHIALSNKVPFLNELYSSIFIGFFFTVGISIFFYYSFEKYFLKLKNKFEIIHHETSK
ncbi:acyltransferase family protein [Aliarcobacter butzleri]|uniref:acyltransferase family protein n=1 Tax=Aliarcobacter butzleri TaxID=28197 RepID=UPI002B24C1B6|nr:acyltransferase [Aliarcobacter butzleri]